MCGHSLTHTYTEGNKNVNVSDEGNEKVKKTELDSGWRWGWWKKNGCKVAWSTRHKTAGFTWGCFSGTSNSVQNQINLSLLDLSATKLKRLSISLTKLWDDVSTDDWIWFPTQTERVAKTYYRMRKRGSEHITWSILVKMSSDKENKGSHYMKESGEGIWAWTL